MPGLRRGIQVSGMSVQFVTKWNMSHFCLEVFSTCKRVFLPRYSPIFPQTRPELHITFYLPRAASGAVGSGKTGRAGCPHQQGYSPTRPKQGEQSRSGDSDQGQPQRGDRQPGKPTVTRQTEAEMRSWSMGQMKQYKAGHRHPSDPEAAPVLGVGCMWVEAPDEASHNFSCHSCKLFCSSLIQSCTAMLYQSWHCAQAVKPLERQGKACRSCWCVQSLVAIQVNYSPVFFPPRNTTIWSFQRAASFFCILLGPFQISALTSSLWSSLVYEEI